MQTTCKPGRAFLRVFPGGCGEGQAAIAKLRCGIARERRVHGKQLELDPAGPSVHNGDRLWGYAM